MDYSELVKALTCGNDGKLPCHNNECPYWVDKWHGIGLCNVIIKDEDAAAAIEDLQADVEELKAKKMKLAENSLRFVGKVRELDKRRVEPKRGEIVRCRECRWGHLCVMGQHLGLDGFCSKGEREVQE